MLCLLIACHLPGAADDPGLAAAVEEVRRAVEAPGAIVGVRHADGSTRLVASGLADLASRRPIGTGDAFFLGSVTKTYTAALVVRLAEAGALSLDDPLAAFVPGFPRGDEITIRHLLAHTSGLKDFYLHLYLRPDRDEMIELVTRTWSQPELLELAGRFGHGFEPGSGWSYSSTNYFLLGVVAERATGSDLATAYRAHLLGPLRLSETWLSLYEDPRAQLAITGYMGRVASWEHSAMFGELGPTTRLDRSNVEWGAGGLAATASDALGFLSALMAGEVVSPAGLAEMLDFRATPPLGVTGAEPDLESGYGLGLARVRRTGYEAIGHGGLFTGHTAGVWYLPRQEVTVALYLNRGFVGQRRMLDRVVREIQVQSTGSNERSAAR